MRRQHPSVHAARRGPFNVQRVWYWVLSLASDPKHHYGFGNIVAKRRHQQIVSIGFNDGSAGAHLVRRWTERRARKAQNVG